MKFKQFIAERLGIRPTISELMRAEIGQIGLQMSEGVRQGIATTTYIVKEKPYLVEAILKDKDFIEPLTGEVTIPVEKLCQSLTDGTKGVKIGNYLIPTSEIRYFKLLKDDE